MGRKIIITTLALAALLAGSVANAQTTSTSTSPTKILPVVYPIAALGGCTSKDACKVYCDAATNRDACYTYAQTHGLMTPAQITLARKLLAQVGPGGCQGDACKTYCNDQTHAEVCAVFAEQNGFISKDDADKRMKTAQVSTTSLLLPQSNTGAPKPPPRPANRPKETSSTGQSSSIFFSVLTFLGI